METKSLKLSTSKSNGRKKRKRCVLIVHNDSVNSFDHVIKTFTTSLPMCNTLRAVQLANLVHENGSASVYHGDQTAALMIYSMLSKSGLTVSVEVVKK
jgi:ATP-dependent Clp protease adapter protein ClpS